MVANDNAGDDNVRHHEFTKVKEPEERLRILLQQKRDLPEGAKGRAAINRRIKEERVLVEKKVAKLYRESKDIAKRIRRLQDILKDSA